MTVVQVLNDAVKILGSTTDSPRLDAEILLSYILRQDRVWLMMHQNQGLSAVSIRQLKSLILQRVRGVPIPYLTGQTDFFGINLQVTASVLVPRPFTELLVEQLLVTLKSYTLNLTIADIGTGSGAIALALAKHLPRAKIIATDVSPAALRVAKSNARRLRLTKRITFQKTSLLKSVIFKPEVLVSNLPYLTTPQLREPSIRREPRLALYGGTHGLDLIRKLISQAKDFPSIKLIALEFDPPQLPVIRRYLKQWSLQVRITTVSDGRKVRGLIAYT